MVQCAADAKLRRQLLHILLLRLRPPPPAKLFQRVVLLRVPVCGCGAVPLVTEAKNGDVTRLLADAILGSRRERRIGRGHCVRVGRPGLVMAAHAELEGGPKEVFERVLARGRGRQVKQRVGMREMVGMRE